MTTGRRKSIVFFIFTLCHAGILVLASEADLVKSVINYGRYETDDAVIIEAPSEETIRQKRHLYRQFEGLLLATGPCFTSKGILGQCTPFRQCYPYFKLPELNNWDTWILGLYDTCTYFTPQGRQMFGVCCSNPVTPVTENPISNPPVIAGTDEDTKKEPANEISEKPGTVTQSHQAVPPNWPPPIPTHGPDNTIPPLPTHPPSPGFPVQTVPPTSPTVGAPTTSKPQSTTWPSKPGKPPQPPVPPQWPPQAPTHPPTPAPPQWPPTQAPPQWPPTHPPTQAPVTDAPGGGGFDGQCGTKEQDRIVGGQNAGVGEWPWIAALFNGGRQFCGGSLIDNIHILSAAHCVAHMSSWDVARLTVRLGDHNIKTNNEITHVEKRVKRVVRHKGFDGRTLYNDVAILTLDSPVTFSRIIRPICLPSGAGSYAGRPATVIGWGSLRESGPQPAVLQKVNIAIWTNNECRQKYGNAAPGGIVEHMLCAGEANKDSCSGDSGGPLMVNEGRWTQVGIVSWGIGCGKGQYPGVYTRVTYFLPWIEKNRK